MRPEELHTALRADLVRILGDVVDLIARIEASIPETGERQDGAVKPRPCLESSSAQASLDSDAGPAPAVTDERPAQPLPETPTDAAPPSVVTAEPPAAPSAVQQQPAPQEATIKPPAKASSASGFITFQEQVLRLWSHTDLPRDEIAAKVGCSPDSIRTFLSIARREGDERAHAREPKPTLIVKDGEGGPTVAGHARPVGPKPFERPTTTPLDPRPGKIAGVVIDRPGSVIAVDMANFVVACPGGDWQVTRPVALVMERMRNGDLFDHQTLAEVGSMGLAVLGDSMKRWTAELAQRGIEFVSMKGVGCRIRVSGT